MLPSIVDIVCAECAVEGRRWRLAPVGGSPLDESMTLEEHEIRDGSLLLLTDDDPQPPTPFPAEPSHIVARIDNDDNARALRIVSVSACLLMAVTGATALTWSSSAGNSNILIAVGLVVTAGVGASVARRLQNGDLMCVTLSAVGILFSAVAGYLAVPASSPAASALLSSTSAVCAAILFRRVITSGAVFLTAAACTSIQTGAVAAMAVAWQLRADSAGALLATAALVVLALSPRLSIWLAGITPSTPNTNGVPATGIDESRVAQAHRTMTSLVGSSSTAAALGAALVAFGAIHRGPAAAAVVFTAVLGLVLLLRSRTHADTGRGTALCAAGILSVITSFAVGIASMPTHAHWIGLVASMIGGAALIVLVGPTIGPMQRRALDLAEYLTLAAVAPLACWVGGVYGAVRGLGLL